MVMGPWTFSTPPLSPPPSCKATSATPAIPAKHRLLSRRFFIGSDQRAVFVSQRFDQFFHTALAYLAIASAAVIGHKAYPGYCLIVYFPAVICFFHAVVDGYRLLSAVHYLCFNGGVGVGRVAFQRFYLDGVVAIGAQCVGIGADQQGAELFHQFLLLLGRGLGPVLAHR